MNTTAANLISDLPAIKSRQQTTWEGGDFGQVAKYIMPSAEEFMARLPLKPVMSFSFPPAETVEFFRRYYGPTGRAFDMLDARAQETLHRDLVKLQTADNVSPNPGTTEVHAEYLEVIAEK